VASQVYCTHYTECDRNGQRKLPYTVTSKGGLGVDFAFTVYRPLRNDITVYVFVALFIDEQEQCFIIGQLFKGSR